MNEPKILFKFRIFWKDEAGERPMGYRWAESKKRAVSNFRWRRRANLCGDDVPGQLIAKLVPGVAPKQAKQELVASFHPQESPRPRDPQLVFGDFLGRSPVY